ncbi:hypothetical protein EB118_08730 [bacterium]|nr:hypothetical protein [bacterium]
MSKRIINESYTFTPSTRTVIIRNKGIKREKLILIINARTNTVIYNFTDPSLGASTYTISSTPEAESTTIVLTYDTQTAGMSSTDPLSIIVDEVNNIMFPADPYRDPVEKMRISTPQSLIDTDFEYGNQSTKWETIALTNNRPSAFYDPTQGISGNSTTLSLPNSVPGTYQITNIVGNGTRLVTVSINNTTGITTSTPVYIQDATDQTANGWYLPYTVTTNTSFTYYARANVTNASIFDTTKTYVFVGAFYTGAPIPAATNAITYVGDTVTVTTTEAHGLTPGQAIYIIGTTATTNPPNGAWYVQRVPASNQFIFTVTGGLPGSITGTITSVLNASVYARTWGSSIHRAFDGGVAFTAGYPYHGNQMIRQTRRYFRYQSGKGIQFSTGSNICAPWQVESITASGTTVTVTTKYIHNVGIGAVVKISGATQTEYNGNFTVTSIPSDTTLTYTALSAPSVSPATTTTGLVAQPYQWYGAKVKTGMFDSQNGLFFEYDGQQLYAVRRSSIFQLPGYVSTIAQGSQTVTGIGTTWSQYLSPGEYIVLRGMSYKVLSIESNTSMTIYPDYKGTSLTGANRAMVTKTVDTRIPQSQWNMDRMDGTGPSGNVLDITKMQMWFIDYSWYGAGVARFGVRDQKGDITYCHRFVHGNNQVEAYMRSGNLPARYEVDTMHPYTKTTATVNTGDTSIGVTTTDGFPSSGALILKAPGTSGAMEVVTYSGKTSASFTGVTRAVTNLTGPGSQTGMGGASTAQTFTYSATAPISVEFWGPQCADTISHWGSSVIMDGRFDDDKSFLFNYGTLASYSATTSGTRYAVFSIRLSPSVDSGLTGTIGQREVINRMQLQPHSMGVIATSFPVRVELLLNARISGGTFVPVGGSSLSQRCDHTNAHTVSGGESILTFFAPAGSFNSFDLTKVRDIGNSILGGGNSFNYPTADTNKYPDGPDTLTITVTPIGGTATVLARMNWTEAQA